MAYFLAKLVVSRELSIKGDRAIGIQATSETMCNTNSIHSEVVDPRTMGDDHRFRVSDLAGVCGKHLNARKGAANVEAPVAQRAILCAAKRLKDKASVAIEEPPQVVANKAVGDLGSQPLQAAPTHTEIQKPPAQLCRVRFKTDAMRPGGITASRNCLHWGHRSQSEAKLLKMGGIGSPKHNLQMHGLSTCADTAVRMDKTEPVGAMFVANVIEIIAPDRVPPWTKFCSVRSSPAASSGINDRVNGGLADSEALLPQSNQHGLYAFASEVGFDNSFCVQGGHGLRPPEFVRLQDSNIGGKNG